MIHAENPFAPDPADRDPARRFRGRLAAPVTIVTSGDADHRAGLTVSSLVVIEGEPGLVQLVVGPTADLWDVVASTGRFVVHVCRSEHRAMADVFAGLRPNPGGVFAGAEVSQSDWGPILDALGDRAYCALRDQTIVGYSGLVTGAIDMVETTDLNDPMLHFRGGYRRLA